MSADPTPAALLTTAEVAAQLGIDASLVRRLARRRGVGERYGRDWLFRPSDLDALRQRKQTRGPEPKPRPA